MFQQADARRRPVVIAWTAAVIMTLVFAGLIGRVWQLQARPQTSITQLAGSQSSIASLFGRRGTIYSRDGRALAVTKVVKRLFVDPMLIDDPNTFSERLGYGLGYDPVHMEQVISRRFDSRYVVIDSWLSDERDARLRAMPRLPGLATQRRLARLYPHGNLAGQVLGVVGVDRRGLEGLELTLNSQLSPAGGRIAYLRDARRRPLWATDNQHQPPRDGQDVRLSIDVTIQHIAEQQLAVTCQRYKASHGNMIAINPRTGEILAMANYPPFDPNKLAGSNADLRRNRCVTDVFEPGSTFKPFVWAAATQAGVVHLDEMIDCTTSGAYRLPFGRVLHDAHANGLQTWDGVLIKSSNIGMGQVGLRLGPRRMHDAVRRFGFGVVGGNEFPGEAVGIVHPVRRWSKYTITSVPMGQEIAVTAMQLTRAFCVFANGGVLLRPTIFAVDGDAPGERVIGGQTADVTRYVLRRVVSEGTGRRANSKMYDLFGKTGTAQVPDRIHGGYEADQYVASFLAGAPYDRPRIVIGCFIHRPDKQIGYYGGIVAAPPVRQVVEQVLPYLGVTPNAPHDDDPRPVQLVSH